MNEFENKIKVLGLELPSAPSAAGNYLPYRMNGNTLYLAGAITMVNGELTHTGKVGEEQTVETGYEVNVPLFINEGDKIKIETEKGTYKERIKE